MNQSDGSILDRLLGHDAGTTRELISIAADLDPAALERAFPIGLGSVRATLHHIVRVMECWMDLMLEKPVRARFEIEAPLSEFSARLDTVASELRTLAETLATEGRIDSTFVDLLDDPPKEKTFGGALVHVATHGMHHRAQVLWMLRELGVGELPEGDALGWEARRRKG